MAFDGVSIDIIQNVLIVTSGLTHKILLQKSLKFENHQELDCFVKELEKKAWFDKNIKNLVWGEIHHSVENGYSIQFTQQKTKGVEVLPISEQAYSLLGEPKEPTDKVFEGLTYSAYENKHLYQWIGAAGITKDITFHCFRHTFATLQLSHGTDIYTVSKMLGHRELKTTQIYAKIVDDTKRKAADKIKLEHKTLLMN